MVKDTPNFKQLAAMAGFALSVFGILLFLWLAFGGSLPLKARGYEFKVAFPEAALLVEEADVRMAGVNIGKVKKRSLTDGGRRTLATIELKSRFAPIPKDTRAILRQKSLLGETYVELAGGHPRSGNLPDGGRLANGNVKQTVELDEVFAAFDAKTRRNYQSFIHDAGIATSGDFAENFNDALGNAAPFFTGGTDLLRPLDAQSIAVRRLVRNTGRVFGAISRENGALRGLIVNGNRTFGALASRDQALADTFQVFPTFLRETRSTVRRLESFARNADPLATDLKAPARDLGPTLRSLGALSPDLERLFHQLNPFIDAAERGLPQASRVVRGAEPVLEAVHTFMPELNPILSYLQFSRAQLGEFLTIGGTALAGNGQGGYTRSTPGVEHYLPQIAMIEPRSFRNNTRRPPYERANAYVSPNAYNRATPLGVIESFDCNAAGGEHKNAVESGSGGPAPPCFVQPGSLYNGQRYPVPTRGRAPLVPAPTGTQGRRPATP
jgi:phospholipid/cholesterol/gamma-HCH transport system substrate-binding protein